MAVVLGRDGGDLALRDKNRGLWQRATWKDYFDKARLFAIALHAGGFRAGDRLAVLSAGAYCMSMASNYNTRPRAAEVLVDGDAARVIRPRESVQDLWRNESM